MIRYGNDELVKTCAMCVVHVDWNYLLSQVVLYVYRYIYCFHSVLSITNDETYHGPVLSYAITVVTEFLETVFGDVLITFGSPRFVLII